MGSFVTRFATVLLCRFPMAFRNAMFLQFSIRLVRGLGASAIRDAAGILRSVGTIRCGFYVQGGLFDGLVVKAGRVRNGRFCPVSGLSEVT